MNEELKITYRQLIEAARTLELDESTTLEEIKSAYRKLARAYHPDAGEVEKSAEKFHKVAAAYRLLIEYARSYRIEFSEEAYLKRYPEEKMWRRFYSDPIWGPGKPDRDEEPP